MGVVVDDIMNYLTMYIYFITNCYIRPTVKRKNGIKYILALTNMVDRRIGCIFTTLGRRDPPNSQNGEYKKK